MESSSFQSGTFLNGVLNLFELGSSSHILYKKKVAFHRGDSIVQLHFSSGNHGRTPWASQLLLLNFVNSSFMVRDLVLCVRSERTNVASKWQVLPVVVIIMAFPLYLLAKVTSKSSILLPVLSMLLFHLV